MTIEEAEAIEEAESLDYEDEPQKPSRKSRDKDEDKLFGLPIPRKQGMIGLLAIVGVVVLLMVAALFSTSFGLVGGVKKVKVFIPAGQGEESYFDVVSWPSLPDSKIADNTVIDDIEIRTTEPAFGKKRSGDADVEVIYDGETLHTATAKVSDGDGKFSVDYSDFYVDNGDYKIKVEFEGESGSDEVTIERTVKKVIVYQYRYEDVGTGEDYLNIKLVFKPSEDAHQNDRSIFTWGHGEIEIRYIPTERNDEKQSNNKDDWDYVETITYDITPVSFNYSYAGKTVKNSYKDADFEADFITIHRDDIDTDAQDQERENGNYTSIVTFYNEFGDTSHDGFDDEMKEGYPITDEGLREWTYFEEDDE